jgi:hypothetical protein
MGDAAVAACIAPRITSTKEERVGTAFQVISGVRRRRLPVGQAGKLHSAPTAMASTYPANREGRLASSMIPLRQHRELRGTGGDHENAFRRRASRDFIECCKDVLWWGSPSGCGRFTATLCVWNLEGMPVVSHKKPGGLPPGSFPELLAGPRWTRIAASLAAITRNVEIRSSCTLSTRCSATKTRARSTAICGSSDTERHLKRCCRSCRTTWRSPRRAWRNRLCGGFTEIQMMRRPHRQSVCGTAAGGSNA